MEENQLVALIKQKDKSAMKSLFGLSADYLTAVCSRYVVSDEDVKDILQDSYVKIFMMIDKFEYRGKGSLKAWMAKIVVNESLKFLKRNNSFNIIQYEDEVPDIVDEQEPETNDISKEAILEMIRLLPIGYRTVFNLYVFEGKSHKEIASILNIKEQTSASQFFRAKRLLAKEINRYKSMAI